MTRDEYKAEVEKKIEEKCKNSEHSLIEITRVGSDLSSEVVRWCSTCGSITVDVDFDGRRQPGAIMKMKSPEITKGLS